jgi:hypothetical protein
MKCVPNVNLYIISISVYLIYVFPFNKLLQNVLYLDDNDCVG